MVQISKVRDEISLTSKLRNIPIALIVVAYLEYQLCQIFLLPERAPDACLCDGAEVDIGAHISEDCLLPPHHHEFDVLLDKVVQPPDVLYPLDVLEVRPHQLLEPLQPPQPPHHLPETGQRGQRVQRYHLLQDDWQVQRDLALSPASHPCNQREEKLVDAKRDVGVGFEVELAVDVGDEGEDESAEDLAEEGVGEVEGGTLVVLEVLCEEGLEVGQRQVDHHLEGLVAVDGLDDAGDVVQVHAEGDGRARRQPLPDDLVDLVQVVHRLPVDPDQRNHVEEGPPLREVLRRDEDRGLQLRQQFAHDRVVGLEGLGVVLAEEGVDGTEEVQRVVHHLAAGVAEVGNAGLYHVHHERLETYVRQLLDVTPEGSRRHAFAAFLQNLLSQRPDESQRCQRVTLSCQFVVTQDDSRLPWICLSFGQQLRTEMQPHHLRARPQCPQVQLFEQSQVPFEPRLEQRQQSFIQICKVFNLSRLVLAVLLHDCICPWASDALEGEFKHTLALFPEGSKPLLSQLLLGVVGDRGCDVEGPGEGVPAALEGGDVGVLDQQLEEGDEGEEKAVLDFQQHGVVHGEVLLDDVEHRLQVVAVVEAEVTHKALDHLLREGSGEQPLVVVLEGVLACAGTSSQYSQQAVQFTPCLLEPARPAHQHFPVPHQPPQQHLVAHHRPEEVGQVDVACRHSGDVFGEVVVEFELVEAEGEGVHEDGFEEAEGEGDDWPQLRVGERQESLDVLDSELQEVGQVAVAEDVDALPVLVVYLAPLHRNVVEHRREHTHCQAVPLKIPQLCLRTGLDGHCCHVGSGVDEMRVEPVAGQEGGERVLQVDLVAVLLQQHFQAHSRQVDQRLFHVPRPIPAQLCHGRCQDASVVARLLRGGVREGEDVLLGASLGDGAVVAVLHEFDHVGGVDEDVGVGERHRFQTLLQVAHLRDHASEPLVRLQPARPAPGDLLGQPYQPVPQFEALREHINDILQPHYQSLISGRPKQSRHHASKWEGEWQCCSEWQVMAYHISRRS